MALRDRPTVGMDERFRFDRATDTVYVNFEGLRLVTAQDADDLAAELDRRFADLGQRVHVVVNYDNFDLDE
jgi:propionate CoA-transferase